MRPHLGEATLQVKLPICGADGILDHLAGVGLLSENRSEGAQ